MGGRIVVLVSGSGSNMSALVHACRAGDVPAEVVAVAADRPCAALEVAESLEVPAHLVAFAVYPTRAAWSTALRERVTASDPDLVVCAGLMRILAPEFVDAFQGRVVNVHPSLLPAFPGAHAVRDALAAGVAVTGATVHHVDRGVDTGKVILQEHVPVLPGDTQSSLHERIKLVEHRLLPAACRLLLAERSALQA
jgi:phosphoribosylglycinamide formyltransferase 1